MRTIKAILLVGLMAFASCESKQDVQNDIERLKNERFNLSHQVSRLKGIENAIQYANATYEEKLREYKLIASGKVVQYIVKFELKQSRFSLSISDHMKDEMNAIEFEMPVSKEFYDSIREGQNIVDEFRSGSVILKGSFSKWKMKVIDKNIR